MPRSLTTTTTQALTPQPGRPLLRVPSFNAPCKTGTSGQFRAGTVATPNPLAKLPLLNETYTPWDFCFLRQGGGGGERQGNWEGVGCGDLWREGVRNTSSHISAPDPVGSSGSRPARRFVVSVPCSRRARRVQTRPKKSSQLAKRALQPPTSWRKEKTCTRARQQPRCCGSPPRTIFKAEITMIMK